MVELRQEQAMSFSFSRFVWATTVIAGGLLTQPAAVQAQSGYYGGPRSDVEQWHLAAGFSDIAGNSVDYLNGGWLVDGGFSYFPGAGALGVRGDLSYSSYAANQNYGYGYSSGPGRFDPGYGAISSAAIGGVARVPGVSRAHFYALGQIGVSYVQLYGNSYNTDRLSWNLGVGVEFPLYWGPNLFLEAQYRQIQTPSPIEYWPITVGLRF
jgi:hypothetical protein